MKISLIGIFLLAVIISLQAQPTSNLVAHYKFNGSANDATGNANNGQLFGSYTWTQDRFGNCNAAIKLNGIGSPGYVRVNNSNSIKFGSNNQFSMSIWVRLDNWTGMDGNGNSNPSGVHQLFSKAGDGIATAGGIHSSLTKSGGNMMFGLANTGSNMSVGGNVYSGFVTGNWVHIVYTAGNGVEKIYSNGVLIATHSATVNFSIADNQHLFMGIMGNTNGTGYWYPLNGAIDDVRLYSRVLTASEITQLYTETNSGPASNASTCGLMAHYKMDNDVLDASGSNNNGSNIGNITGTQNRFGACQKSLSFNGSNYVTIPSSLIGASNYMTISCWIKFEQGGTINPRIISCINNLGGYELSLNGTGASRKLIFFFKDLYNYSNTTLNENIWYHVVMVGKPNEVKLYINNQLDGTFTGTTNSITPTGPTNIGRKTISAYDIYKGTLDDLRIYNRALSAAEITALYTAAPDYPAPADDLNCGQMAWYKFDGNLNDASNNGHTLSLGVGTVAYGKDRKNNCDRSLYLNGSTYLKTPTTPLLESPNYTNQFSVSAWVNTAPLGTGTHNGEFLSKSSTTQDGLFAAGFQTGGTGLGLKRGNLWLTSTTNQANKWYHIVLVANNGVIKYYRDNQFLGQITYTPSNYVLNLQMEVGRHTPGGTEYAKMYLDDLRLYNRALTATEVTLLYNTLPSSPNPVPAASVSSSATAICSGQSVTLTAATNTTGVTYQWIKDNNNISGATGTTYTASQSGSYRVRITKTNGCDSLSLPVTIAVNSLPTAQASANTPCAGQNLNLSLTTNGNTYSWTGPASFTSTQQNPIRSNSQTTMSGTYTVTVTNAAGCTTTSTTSVTVKTAPTATVTANSPCAGQNLSLNLSTNGSNYAWAGPLGFSATQQNPVRTNSQPAMSGAYTVTVTNAVGCTTTASVTATVLAVPTVSAVANPVAVCQGTSVTLSASGGTTYTWNGGLGSGSTQTVVPGTNSTYTVTATNSNGCSGTGSTTVTVYPLPNAYAGSNQEVCQGGNVTLTATGGTFYNWNNTPGNTATIQVTPVNSTSYVVTVTDGNGCTDTDDVTVTVRPLPVVNAGPDMAICLHESALLNAGNGSGFLWSNGIAGPFQYVSPSATTTYSLTVTNQYHCTDTDDVIITVNPLPTGSCFPDKAIYCEGETAVLTALGGVKFYWQHPNGTPEAPVTAPFIIENLTLPLDQGLYPVIVEDANGCRDTTSLYLNLKPSPQVSITGTTPICFEASTLFTVTTNGASFQWSNGDNQHTSLYIFPSSSGSETYAVTVTGDNGCTRSASKVLVVHPRPNIDIKGDERPICIGSDTTLVVTGSGASVYIWNTGQNTNSINVAPLTTTEYRLIGNNQYGCPDTAFATVVVRTPPVAHPRMDIIACMEDREITGLLPDGGKGRWYSLNGAVIQEPDSSITQAMDLSPGFNRFLWKVQTPPCPGEITDTLVVRLANTLPDVNKDSLLVIQETAIELPLFDNDLLGPLSEISVHLQKEEFQGNWAISPDGILSFDPENDFTGDVINHYTVCNALCPEYCDSATIVIKIRQPDNDIGETLVITPGDQNGKNDALSFDYLSQYPNNSITIFNRWGQQVYYAKPYNNDWAGAYNGKPLPAGTYYFVLNLIDEDELVWGNILIVR